jgi:hypothetical protein
MLSIFSSVGDSESSLLNNKDISSLQYLKNSSLFFVIQLQSTNNG